jgi:hypothetical protein
MKTTPTRTCAICGGTKTVKHYRSGFSTQLLRCGACKGTGLVTAETWLKAWRALPRTFASRADAIEWACHYLGRHKDGTVDPISSGVEILHNGVAGFLLDLRAAGFGDVAERVKAVYLTQRPFEASTFESFIAEISDARAEMRAPRAKVAHATA